MKIRTKIKNFLLTLINMNIFTSDQGVRFENTLSKKLRAYTGEILSILGGKSGSFRKKNHSWKMKKQSHRKVSFSCNSSKLDGSFTGLFAIITEEHQLWEIKDY